MNKPTKIIAAAGTIALAGGIGAGLAYADSPPDSPTASPTAPADRQGSQSGRTGQAPKADREGDPRGGDARRREAPGGRLPARNGGGGQRARL